VQTLKSVLFGTRALILYFYWLQPAISSTRQSVGLCLSRRFLYLLLLLLLLLIAENGLSTREKTNELMAMTFSGIILGAILRD
jgi:hypothetical protein